MSCVSVPCISVPGSLFSFYLGYSSWIESKSWHAHGTVKHAHGHGTVPSHVRKREYFKVEKKKISFISSEFKTGDQFEIQFD